VVCVAHPIRSAEVDDDRIGAEQRPVSGTPQPARRKMQERREAVVQALETLGSSRANCDFV
jgi:hypothetical protein